MIFRDTSVFVRCRFGEYDAHVLGLLHRRLRSCGGVRIVFGYPSAVYLLFVSVFMAAPLFIKRTVVFVGFHPLDIPVSFAQRIQNLSIVPLASAAIIPVCDFAVRTVVDDLSSVRSVVFAGRTKAFIHHLHGLAGCGEFLFEAVALAHVFLKFLFAQWFVSGHGGYGSIKQERGNMARPLPVGLVKRWLAIPLDLLCVRILYYCVFVYLKLASNDSAFRSASTCRRL